MSGNHRINKSLLPALVAALVLLIWGLPAARFYENPKLWRDFIHPDHQQVVSEVYDAEIANPTGRDLHLLYRIVRPDGPDGHPPYRDGGSR